MRFQNEQGNQGERRNLTSSGDPTLDVELALMREGFNLVGGIDEVGTGSAVGPCACAIVVVNVDAGPIPTGLKDSKALSASTRESLVPMIETWALERSIGMASVAEIDRYGLTVALRLAGYRALSELTTRPDVLLLDGKRDWLTLPFEPQLDVPNYPDIDLPAVRTLVKADRTCASVSAASVLAKVVRDELLVGLSPNYPHYGWAKNKGYLSPEHLQAIDDFGLTEHHRSSWNLQRKNGEAPR
ncbi:MAG: ribonuclease HII [Actinomycetota bacterium]